MKSTKYLLEANLAEEQWFSVNLALGFLVMAEQSGKMKKGESQQKR